ncbi:MAG: hypothetical protein HY885_00135 [Deltaproteobacteria bacterium]|nr:hypothetical protein [Deltaproteobacteria bacterium]
MLCQISSHKSHHIEIMIKISFQKILFQFCPVSFSRLAAMIPGKRGIFTLGWERRNSPLLFSAAVALTVTGTPGTFSAAKKLFYQEKGGGRHNQNCQYRIKIRHISPRHTD